MTNLNLFSGWDSLNMNKIVVSVIYDQKRPDDLITEFKNKFPSCVYLVSSLDRCVNEKIDDKIMVYDLHRKVKDLATPCSSDKSFPYNKPLLIVDIKLYFYECFYISRLMTDPVNVLFIFNTKSIIHQYISYSDFVIHSDSNSFNLDMSKYGSRVEGMDKQKTIMCKNVPDYQIKLFSS